MRFLFKEEYAAQPAPIIIIPLIAIAMAIGTISFANALGWLGKPFPGFFYYKNLVVSFYQRSAWMGWDKGLRAYDLITEVDGKPVKTVDEFREVFDLNKNKKSINYTVNRDGKASNFAVDIKDLSIEDFFFAFLLPFLLGMFFLVAGGLVYFAKSNKATLVNFFMCLLIALSYMTMFDSNTTYKFSQFWLIYPLFGAISAYLFLLFSEERDLVKRNRWIRYLPYIPALLLILFRYLSENNPSLSILFSKLSLLYMGGIFVLDLSLLIVIFANTKEGVIKQRAKIVAFGLVVASLIPVTWSALNALWRPVVGFDYAMGLAIVFPALVGYAATKRRFSKGRTVEVDEVISNLELDTSESEKLKNIGVRYLIPMFTKSGVLGIIALGEKLSKLPLSRDEIKLLEGVAHQTAISIENLRLYEEKSRDERLATLGQVASMIIHEIKNPLGIIRVSSGTLKKKFEKVDDQEGKELATFIEEEVLRMDTTARKFLSYVRPQEPSLKWVNINEVIRKALKTLSTELESLKVETRLKSNLDEIEADADQLYQTFINLILNARDASPFGGRLIIRTNERDGVCAVAIADTGKGIEKGVVESIFKPFYSGKRGGIGLGLTIAHQIVENHGGKIRVKSTEGRGTVFLIILPKRRKEAKDKWKKLFLS